MTRYFIAIETSCDETSLAIGSFPTSRNNFLEYLNSTVVHASIIASQAKLFERYGGVIPEVSARHHAEQIFELFDLVLTQAMQKTQLPRDELLKSVSNIYVTTQPGLASALRVGSEFAKVLAYHIEAQKGSAHINPINHLYGHIMSAFFEQQEQRKDDELFPHLHLLVSGGNTQLLLMRSPHDFTIIGQRLDDAAGECLDKIGRMVGLPYPAGATMGAIAGEQFLNPIHLPIGMSGHEEINFSYSGLKTAVRYFIRDNEQSGLVYEQPLTSSEIEQLKSGNNLNTRLQLIRDILISTQTVVITQLMNQTKKALAQHSPRSLGLSGGVSASKALRSRIMNLHTNFFLAPLALTGDNAVMIGLAGIAQEYQRLF